jgi:hypothetical protein
MNLWRQCYCKTTFFVGLTLCMVAILSIYTANSFAAPKDSSLVRISGLSPYTPGCNADDKDIGIAYVNSETEPHMAVNPTDGDNMIAAWHQDRWSSASAGAAGIGAAYSNDGGSTWHQVTIPFTTCTGSDPELFILRGTDPWLTYGPDGSAYLMVMAYPPDSHTPSGQVKGGMFVSKSIDGGMTWSDPITLTPRDWTWGKWHDKNAITANPLSPDLVHATWTLFHEGNTSIAYTDSMDGGLSWSKPVNIITQRPVKDTEPPTANNDSQAGAQIVVLNDGTLVNVMSNTLSENQGNAGSDWQVSVLRSFDNGRSWERDPIYIADIVPTVRGRCSAFDVELEVPVRDAQCFIPEIAVNSVNNNLYVVWQDAGFNPDGLAGAVISMSSDGGDTWTDPIQVNQVAPESQAFLPTVEVADDGTVGVLFYDFRNDGPGDAALDTDVHLAFFDGDLNHLGEKRLTSESFNIRQMVIAGSRGYFPGDYVGLSHAGNDFVAAFTVANELGLPVEYPQVVSEQRVDDNNRQDIVFGRASLSDITGKGKGN